MPNFVKIPVREQYCSDEALIMDRMGPMKFPILDSALELKVGKIWSVTRYSYPRNQQEFTSLSALVKGASFAATPAEGEVTHHTPIGATGSNVILANAAQGKVTIIRGDWNLADLGIEVRQGLEYGEDDVISVADGKESKRMKAFARPFRIHTRRDNGLRVLVMDAKDHPMLLDGASLISEDVVLDCISNLSYPTHKYFNYEVIRRYMLDQLVFNGVLVGRLINAETGENLNMMGKGQYLRCTLPEGVDVITTPENLKSEISGTGPAFVGIEPQGPKVAREDQQTVANQQFLCQPADCRTRLDDDATNNLRHVFNGKFRESTQRLSSLVYRADNAFTETSFAAVQKWRTEAWALHSGSYLWSPWLTQQIASMWVRTLGYGTASWNNRLHVKIPCAMRAQVVTEKLVNTWRYFQGIDPMTVAPGHLCYDPTLKVGVVSNDDWENIVYDSHGGCDLDDFFVLRWVTIDGEPKIVINRSPNARGEYSIWDYTEGDWFPTHTNSKDEEITFPDLSTEFAPMQILEALDKEITRYVPLPSETRIRAKNAGHQIYDNTSCLGAIAKVMNIEGGYGQYELAVRARNSQDPFTFDEIAIYSEAAVDAFAQAALVEDQQFILADRDRIVSGIIESFIPVDDYIGPRLGNNNIMTTPNGPISNLKIIIREVVERYQNTVRAEISSLEEPQFLIELGENRHIDTARMLLKHVRASMFVANSTADAVTAQVTRGANIDQNDILVEYFAKIPEGRTCHDFAMAFWHACWTTPTSSGRITDQPVFGTEAYEYVLEALIYFGIVHRPFVESDGTVDRHDLMSYDGNHNCVAICKACGEEKTIPTKVLDSYWSQKGICQECRPLK